MWNSWPVCSVFSMSHGDTEKKKEKKKKQQKTPPLINVPLIIHYMHKDSGDNADLLQNIFLKQQFHLNAGKKNDSRSSATHFSSVPLWTVKNLM